MFMHAIFLLDDFYSAFGMKIMTEKCKVMLRIQQKENYDDKLMGNKPYIIRNTELRYGNTSGLMKAKVMMYRVQVHENGGMRDV